MSGAYGDESNLNPMQRQWIKDMQHEFPDGFFRWLQHNYHIWKSFESKALMMSSVRKKYSARTIIEVMRWETDLYERTKADQPAMFKLSNNMVPGLARLWMAKHGARNPKFFNLRSEE